MINDEDMAEEFKTATPMIFAKERKGDSRNINVVSPLRYIDL